MTKAPIEHAENLYNEYNNRSLNEADTRHQIIDVIIHDVLEWPRKRVLTEKYIRPGYADYAFVLQSGDSGMLLEAKKEGDYFELPNKYRESALKRWVSLKELVSKPDIKSAAIQVREYCNEDGIEVAGITNGHVWIFFKAYVQNRKWYDQKALVITSLEYFFKEYTDASNLLSYGAISKGNALRSLLNGSLATPRSIYYPKDNISSFDQPVRNNSLGVVLRPIAANYFGVLNAHDHDLMDACYVGHHDFKENTKGVRSLIKDSLSPYMIDKGVVEAGESEPDGAVAKKIVRAVQRQIQGRVIVLFGGKGAGKSTFIRRLLLHKPPEYLTKHGVTVVIDFLNTPETKEQVTNHVWNKLIDGLDQEDVLKGDREGLYLLFSDRYEVALKQELAGIDPQSEAYNLRVNQMIAEWKRDREYVAARLGAYWRKKHKGIVVVFDNTDQYKAAMQDYCFTTAQDISSKIGSVTVLSMREERFHNSKIHGLLDAYQTTGYHVQSPASHTVFKRRIDYVRKLIREGDLDNVVKPEVARNKAQDADKFLTMLSREFSKEHSIAATFFTACAHGNIRLALDLFSGFLTSGYTQTDEMISSARFTIQLHQTLKPVMIPDRFFYDEAKSEFPNILKPRDVTRGSHFTSLRLLSWLDSARSAGSGYVSLSSLKSVFSDRYGMLRDMELNLAVLLETGLIESNNRIDTYTEDLDLVTITPYGIYALQKLCGNFAYLDLITLDCGVFDSSVSAGLSDYGAGDYRAFKEGKKYDRVVLRLEKVETFLRYLRKEMDNEISKYGGCTEFGDVLGPIEAGFARDKKRVLRSASKNRSSVDEMLFRGG